MFDTDHITFGIGHPPGAPQALLSRSDRRQHLYSIGKTGTGKTTLLERLIVQDIQNGEGVALLDPHGDLAERLLDYVPPRRIDDVVYFNPADLERPIGMNIVADCDPELRHLAVSGAVAAFHAIWRDSWGPRLEYILSNTLAALMEIPDATLLLVPRLFTDDAYRARVSQRVSDPVVARFWHDEFADYDKRFRSEATAPILNKIGQFFMSTQVRNIFGQLHNTIHFRRRMDERKIMIANLSKGKIGSDKSNLIGSLLVSQFELAAMSRSDLPEHHRADFYLYADEFQNFATNSFATILSEARKYRLSLHLFHQFLDQLDDHVRDAVFGNVGTMLAFRVGRRDAERLAHEYENDLVPRHFTDLERYQLYARALDHGEYGTPYHVATEPVCGTRYGKGKTVIEQSRMRFGKPRAKVERTVSRML